jgi:hypothetical protein
MRWLPMEEARDRRRGGESLASLMAGVPSLAIGLVSSVLLASYLLQRPFGPPGLYRVERFPAVRSPVTGQAIGQSTVSLVLPSSTLLGMLVAGAWCGGLGIILDCRRGHRRRATTSIAGTIACAAAFLLAWIASAWAASL